MRVKLAVGKRIKMLRQVYGILGRIRSGNVNYLDRRLVDAILRNFGEPDEDTVQRQYLSHAR